MIKVTRMNRTQYVINCDHIETVEATPDTVITLLNGKKYIVTETVRNNFVQHTLYEVIRENMIGEGFKNSYDFNSRLGSSSFLSVMDSKISTKSEPTSYNFV